MCYSQKEKCVHLSDNTRSRQYLCRQNMCMCENTLSKTQHAERIKCNKTPWSSYVKLHLLKNSLQDLSKSIMFILQRFPLCVQIHICSTQFSSCINTMCGTKFSLLHKSLDVTKTWLLPNLQSGHLFDIFFKRQCSFIGNIFRAF